MIWLDERQIALESTILINSVEPSRVTTYWKKFMSSQKNIKPSSKRLSPKGDYTDIALLTGRNNTAGPSECVRKKNSEYRTIPERYNRVDFIILDQ